jgi:TonB family protein
MIVQTLLLAAASPSPIAAPIPPRFTPTTVEDSRDWFRNERLPAGFGARRAEASVAWTALIGFDGRVLNCIVRQTSEDTLLDEQTCKIVRQWGRFKAALDDEGRPVMAYYEATTRWTGLSLRLPDPVVKSDATRNTVPNAPPLVSLPPTPRPFPAKAELRSRSWLSTDDYPPSALRRFEEGQVAIRLYVGTDGRVFACRIDQSAGDTLDTETCKIAMRRVRFHPALDKGGKPMTDTYTTRVIWRIPNDPILPVRFVKTGGEKVEIRLRFGPRRKIIECAAYSAKPEVQALSQAICAAYAKELKASRFDKPKGSPLPGAATIPVRIAMSKYL